MVVQTSQTQNSTTTALSPDEYAVHECVVVVPQAEQGRSSKFTRTGVMDGRQSAGSPGDGSGSLAGVGSSGSM